MKRLTAFLTLLVALAFGSRARAAATGPTLVALSGMNSPLGSKYTGFGFPLLNSAGQVAFSANLNRSPGTLGIFSGNVGSLQPVAVQGDAIPGGGTFDSMGLLALNSRGQVGFTSGGSQPSTILVGIPGLVQVAAKYLSPAPAGGIYHSLQGIGRSPVFNDAGQVAFFATLTSGATSGQGVFAGAPGSMQAVAIQGTPASIGGTFSGFHSPVFNNSGQVAVLAGVSNGGSSVWGIFAGTPNALQPVGLDGAPAPAGGNYDSFASFPGINDAGEVVVLSFLKEGSSTEGIFAGSVGSMQTIALKGDTAPSGGNFSNFNTPIINASGQVAFRSNLSGGSASIGLFEGTPGNVKTVALTGDNAPGGGTFSDFVVALEQNASGQVAFTANLMGSGVDTTNDVGLYCGRPGDLTKIVREGDIVDVDASPTIDNRTVSTIAFYGGSGGQDGEGQSISDAGTLIYKLSFTDGSSGIFTSSITQSLPGDFNHDGTVDAADYVVWRSVAGPSSDYDLWRAHFGESVGMSGSTVTMKAVPEPQLFALLFVLAVGHLPWRKRRPH